MAFRDSYRLDHDDRDRKRGERGLKREMYRFGGDTKRMPESGRSFAFRANGSKTYERPLLQSVASSDIGFPTKGSSKPKFQLLDHLTDSDEEAMDVSEPEDEQRPFKKRIIDEREIVPEPKWSNPEIYSALPPLSENRKRKDVVQLIRKARLEPTAAEQTQTPVQTNEDFISLDFLSDEILELNHAPSNAPSGPRSMNKSSLATKRKREQDPEYDRDRQSTSLKARQGQKTPSRLVASEINGSILPVWRPVQHTKSTPWFIEKIDAQDSMRNGLTSLHKEILDFYDWVRPQDHERDIRADLVSRLHSCLRKYEPGSQIFAFGSFASGLYLPTGDMDLVLIESDSLAKLSNSRFWRYVHYIKDSSIAVPSSIQSVPHAKVPIIKFVDKFTGLNVDLSFNNMTGVVANDTYKKWKAAYPALSPLIAVLKQYLLMRGLSDVSLGGLGGFSLTCLITSLIQHLPMEKKPPNLGRMLLEFLNLYGKHFNYQEHGIRLDPPGYFDKNSFPYFEGQRQKRERLAISDPNRPENDVSGGTSKIGLIFEIFSEAYDVLEEALDEYNLGINNSGSLLGDLIAGDYSTYEYQRSHLLKISERDGIVTADREAPHPSANGRSSGSRISKPNIDKTKNTRAPKSAQRDDARLNDERQAKSLGQAHGTSQASSSSMASKAERRANRLRELRPDIPDVAKALTVNEAVKLGGYHTSEELQHDLQVRERRINAAKK